MTIIKQICCRYCGHLFTKEEIPTIYKTIEQIDEETSEKTTVNILWEHKRCPSCLHVIEYSNQKNLPGIVKWKEDIYTVINP